MLCKRVSKRILSRGISKTIENEDNRTSEVGVGTWRVVLDNGLLKGRRSELLGCVTGLMLACSAFGCSAIADSSIAGSGVGGPCKADSDCQGSSCDDGVCVLICDADGDCPASTKCLGKRCIVPDALASACVGHSNCMGGRCDDGICVSECTSDIDCPGELKCYSNKCQETLKVGGAWVGVVSTGEGWTLTHQEGVEDAKKNLPYIEFTFKEELIGDVMADAIDEFVADKREVIIANSFDHVPQVTKKSEQYPDTKFLICSGNKREPNVGAYFGHLEQAWFVAGQLAARKTKTKRLGFIGSYITPEVVRHLNAFALGARRDDPEIKVEVRWLGFWYDPDFTNPQYEYTPKHMGSKAKKFKLTGEEYLTAKLIDSGADVLAHQCDNQMTSRYVAKHTDDGSLLDEEGNPKAVYVIANDNRYGWRQSDQTPYSGTIGSVYWNWGPLYTRMLSEIHRKVWEPGDIKEVLLTDPALSAVGVELSTGEKDIADTTLRSLLLQASNAGPDFVFQGPYLTNANARGQSMGEGETIRPEEYATMCWFVDNVVERSNPNDPTSPDQPAQVPGKDHVGRLADKTEPADPVANPRQPSVAPEVLISFVSDTPAAFWNCLANQYPPLN